MRKLTFKILIFTLCALICLGFFGCDTSVPDNSVTEPSDDEGTGENENLHIDEIAFIENNVANFTFVFASDVSGDLRGEVYSLTDRLRSLGVNISEPVNHTDYEAVTECEIIIGVSVKNREDKYSVNPYELGDDGYVVKAIDKKLVIAGGTSKMTEKAFEYFKEHVLSITDETNSFASLYVKKDFEELKLTEYSISSVKIGERELSEYTILLDIEKASDYNTDDIRYFKRNLYRKTGYALDVGYIEKAGNYKNRFIIRCTDDAGEDGFRAYATDSDFIIECSYVNAFTKTFIKFIDELIFGRTGDIVIPADFSSTYNVSSVKYSDFGAVGDGKTDDWRAIYNTHAYANQGGQKVYGDEGATYYIHTFNDVIRIKTDVDFNGATFHLNDKGDEVYASRGVNLFTISRDVEPVVISSQKINELFPNDELSKTDTGVEWLAEAGYLTGEWNMIRFTNDHKDFIRHGSNINNGDNRTDIVIADANGNPHEDTPAIFDFKAEDQLINNGLQYKWYRVSAGERHNFTKIEIFRVDDKPITVENGYFEREVCNTVKATEYENKYHAYTRAFCINRSNVLIKDIQHVLLDEPAISGNGKGSDGKYKQSYPYYGFFRFENSYNSTAEDCNLTGHTTYYEAKSTQSNPVAMGSYDLVIEYSSHIRLKNVIQNDADERLLGDSHYWGIMSSNGAKNLSFDNCKISRFDAHRGFWNATLKNCTIGQNINVIGGGTLNLDNVKKLVGETFISMRGDYGATFEGDISIKDCTLVGHKTYNGSYTENSYYGITKNMTVISSGFQSDKNEYKGHYEPGKASDYPYLKWDFGYTCYMPKNVVVDNFKLGEKCKGRLYLYNNIGNYAFEKPADFTTSEEQYHIMIKTLEDGSESREKVIINEEDVYYNQYVITESITYRNMTALDVCPIAVSTSQSSKAYYSKILSIPTYTDEQE